LQLLRDLGARPALFDHLDNGFEVAIGAFQTSGNRGICVVRHSNLLSSRQDSNHPPRRIENLLDSGTGQAYLPNCCREPCVRDKPFNPDEEHMGSSTFGNVNPAMTGLALPQDNKINRAGLAARGVMVAPS
jgi:hypothetical protein